MKFNSQICTTKEQSERLLALELKKETADIVIRPDNTLIVINENSFIYHNLEKAIQEGYLPAWSFHRLIEMMPSNLSDNSEIDFSKFGVFYAIFHNGEYCLTHAFAKKEKVLYDNIIDCIEWLIKEGYFNKEYLEE